MLGFNICYYFAGAHAEETWLDKADQHAPQKGNLPAQLIQGFAVSLEP